MTSAVRLVTIIAAGSLSLPLVAAGQSHGAERIVTEALYDRSGSFFSFPCSADGELLPEFEGELIALEGHVYERVTALEDAAGGLHYSINTMPVGLRGIGESSGEEFRIRENEMTISRQRLEGLVGSYRQELTLVGSDTHRTFQLVGRGHYVIAADGTITLTRDALQRECRVH